MKNSKKIYNVLISENFIGEPAENVVIYELDAKKNSCDVVFIQHIDAEIRVNLEAFYTTLIYAKRDTIYVEQFIFELQKQIVHGEKLTINKIIEVYTKKPIP